MNEILTAFLAKTLNIGPDSIAELLYKKSDDGTLTTELKDNALSELLAADAQRISKIKPSGNGKEQFDNGHKAGLKEAADKYEKAFRSKFNVDPDGKLQGDALVDAALQAASAASQNPDSVKRSAEYVALERQMREAIEAERQTAQQTIEAIKGEYTKKDVWSNVKGKIVETVKGLNPVLPSDAAKSQAWLDLFASEFQSFDWQEENGNFYAVRDGKRVENAHGHAQTLKDLVKVAAESKFDFQQTPPSGGGNQNPGANGGGKFTGKFRNEEDYFTQWNSASDSDKKVLNAAWNAQNGEN
jgi:hypothetical protein